MQDGDHQRDPVRDVERDMAASADSTGGRFFSRRRLLIGGLSVGLFLLVAAGGLAGYIAYSNKQKADRWVEHAHLLQNNLNSLEAELTERTDDLNQRTEDLNGMASKVQLAETAIARSEADVRSLERRQRRLANEKAQVEDARAELAVQTAALEDVAAAYVDCNSGLFELLNYIVVDDYVSANAVAASVDADCSYATDSLSGYLARYSG